MAARDRSRSSEPHRCSLGINAVQKEDLDQAEIVRKAWFGNGTSVPVKDSIEAAVEAAVDANGTLPDYVLTFGIPLRTFHKWIHEGTMTPVKHLHGYRVKCDLNLKELDPEWKVHPVQ